MTSCGVMWIRTAAAKRSEIITDIKVFKWNKVVAAFDIVHLECTTQEEHSGETNG